MVSSSPYVKKYLFGHAGEQVMFGLKNIKKTNVFSILPILMMKLTLPLKHFEMKLEKINNIEDFEIDSNIFSESLIIFEILSRGFKYDRDRENSSYSPELNFHPRHKLMLKIFPFIQKFLFKLFLKNNLLMEDVDLRLMCNLDSTSLLLEIGENIKRFDDYVRFRCTEINKNYKLKIIYTLAVNFLELLNHSLDYGIFSSLYEELHKQIIDFSEQISEFPQDKLKPKNKKIKEEQKNTKSKKLKSEKEEIDESLGFPLNPDQIEEESLLPPRPLSDKTQDKSPSSRLMEDLYDDYEELSPYWRYPALHLILSEFISLQNSVLFLSNLGVVDARFLHNSPKSGKENGQEINHSQLITSEKLLNFSFANLFKLIKCIKNNHETVKTLIEPVFTQLLIVFKSISFLGLEQKNHLEENSEFRRVDAFYLKVKKLLENEKNTLLDIGLNLEDSKVDPVAQFSRFLGDLGHESKNVRIKNLRRNCEEISKIILSMFKNSNSKQTNEKNKLSGRVNEKKTFCPTDIHSKLSLMFKRNKLDRDIRNSKVVNDVNHHSLRNCPDLEAKLKDNESPWSIVPMIRGYSSYTIDRNLVATPVVKYVMSRFENLRSSIGIFDPKESTWEAFCKKADSPNNYWLNPEIQELTAFAEYASLLLDEFRVIFLSELKARGQFLSAISKVPIFYYEQRKTPSGRLSNFSNKNKKPDGLLSSKTQPEKIRNRYSVLENLFQLQHRLLCISSNSPFFNFQWANIYGRFVVLMNLFHNLCENYYIPFKQLMGTTQISLEYGESLNLEEEKKNEKNNLGVNQSEDEKPRKNKSILQNICLQSIILSKKLKLDKGNYSEYLEPENHPELLPIVTQLSTLVNNLLDGSDKIIQADVADLYSDVYRSMVRKEVEYIMSPFATIKNNLMQFNMIVIDNKVIKRRFLKDSSITLDDVYSMIIKETQRLVHYLLYKKYFNKTEKKILDLEQKVAMENKKDCLLMDSFHKFVFKDKNWIFISKMKKENKKSFRVSRKRKNTAWGRAKKALDLKLEDRLQNWTDLFKRMMEKHQNSEENLFSDFWQKLEEVNGEKKFSKRKLLTLQQNFQEHKRDLNYNPYELIRYYQIYFENDDSWMSTKIQTLLGLKALIVCVSEALQGESDIWKRNCELSETKFKDLDNWIGKSANLEENLTSYLVRSDGGFDVELGLLKFLNTILGSVEILDRYTQSKLMMFHKHPAQVKLPEKFSKIFVEDLDLDNKIVDVYEKLPEIQIILDSALYRKKHTAWLEKISTYSFFHTLKILLWYLGLALNINILLSYRRNPETAKDYSELGSGEMVQTNKNSILFDDIIEYIILGLSGIMILIWVRTQWLTVYRKEKATYLRLNKKKPNFLVKLWLMGKFCLNDRTFMSFMLHHIFAWVSIFWSPFFASLHLLLLLSFREIIRTVLKSFTQHLGSILYTLIFTCFVIYSLSIIQGNLFYYNMDSKAVGDDPFCPNMIACFLNNLNFGLRMGGGVGETMEAISWGTEKFFRRFLFDLCFFLIINVIFLSIVSGLIIDSFAEIRTEAEDKSNFFLIRKNKEYDLLHL